MSSWEKICYQVSVGEIVYVEQKTIPPKGMARLTIHLPMAPPRMIPPRVEYLAVDGLVLAIDLIITDEDRQSWNEKFSKLIEEVDVRKFWRV